MNTLNSARCNSQCAVVVREKPDMAMFCILWLLAALVFGAGDILTSTAAFSLGAVEANPVVRALLEVAGGNIWSWVVMKAVFMACLALLSYTQLGKCAWVIPLMFICTGGYLLLQNAAVIMLLA